RRRRAGDPRLRHPSQGHDRRHHRLRWRPLPQLTTDTGPSMNALNETHDPARTSWVASANAPGCDFPIQNLPFGAFRPRADGAAAMVGVGIGDRILDVAAVAPFVDAVARDAAAACASPHLNDLMALGPTAWSALRRALSRLLSDPGARERVERFLTPMAQAELF